MIKPTHQTHNQNWSLMNVNNTTWFWHWWVKV